MCVVVDFLGKGTFCVPFVCKSDGHLCCLAAQYTPLLAYCRVEVIVSIALNLLYPTAALAVAWHLLYRFVIILQGAEPFGGASLQVSLLHCTGFSH